MLVVLLDTQALSTDTWVLPRQRFYMAIEGQAHPILPVTLMHSYAYIRQSWPFRPSLHSKVTNQVSNWQDLDDRGTRLVRKKASANAETLIAYLSLKISL